jgi:MFS family permease
MALICPLFIFASSVTMALAIGALFGLAYGAYISVDYALGTDVLPEASDAGKDMGVWHIAMTLPQTIMIPIAGFLIAQPGVTKLPPEKLGDDPIYHYTHAGYAILFLMAAVLFALGAVGLRKVRSVR